MERKPVTVFVALLAFDDYMFGKDNTMPNRVDAMRAALAAVAPRDVAMCETCLSSWPLTSAPAVCPVCNKGRAHHA